RGRMGEGRRGDAETRRGDEGDEGMRRRCEWANGGHNASSAIVRIEFTSPVPQIRVLTPKSFQTANRSLTLSFGPHNASSSIRSLGIAAIASTLRPARYRS